MDVLFAQPKETVTGNLDDNTIKGCGTGDSLIELLNIFRKSENVRLQELDVDSAISRTFIALFRTHFTSYTIYRPMFLPGVN